MGSMQSFEYKFRVPYAHIDKMGIVYYARYYVYFEMARSSLFRHLGLPYGELEERGVMLPVIASHCDYKKPARFDEELAITIPSIDLRDSIILYVQHICYRAVLVEIADTVLPELYWVVIFNINIEHTMQIGHNNTVLQAEKLCLFNIHYTNPRILDMNPSYHIFYQAFFYLE